MNDRISGMGFLMFDIGYLILLFVYRIQDVREFRALPLLKNVIYDTWTTSVENPIFGAYVYNGHGTLCPYISSSYNQTQISHLISNNPLNPPFLRGNKSLPSSIQSPYTLYPIHRKS